VTAPQTTLFTESELGSLVEDGYLVLEGRRRGARYRAGPHLAQGDRK